MHLLYVDESGSPGDPNQNFFVLSGVSIFERKTHWVEAELNKIVARFNPADPYALELHGSPMRSGKSEWKHFPEGGSLPSNQRLSGYHCKIKGQDQTIRCSDRAGCE